jgi:diguanylate cyclase (GGDEF)-like protein
MRMVPAEVLSPNPPAPGAFVKGRRTAFAAPLSAALVLLALAVATAVGFLAVLHSNQRVTEARDLVTVHLALERAVAAEAAAEAGYRRSPGADTRAVFDGSVAAVGRAVRAIPHERGGRVLALPSVLRTLNDRYVADVRRSFDTGDVVKEDLIAGPAMRAMQELLDDEVSQHRGAARQATEAQSVVLRWLAVVLPAVFVVAFALLGFGLRSMLLDHRRLRLDAAHSRTLAQTDFLTGLSNRSHLEVVMKELLSRPTTPGALLYLDLDRFKPVNDVHGHHAGDLVLTEVARRLRETVRSGATVARLGGDEFVVVLPECTTPRRVAARLVEAVEAPIDIEGTVVTVGTSVGIAPFPDVAAGLGDLLRAADVALYEAKRTGRRGIVVARAVTSADAAPTEGASTRSASAPLGDLGAALV